MTSLSLFYVMKNALFSRVMTNCKLTSLHESSNFKYSWRKKLKNYILAYFFIRLASNLYILHGSIIKTEQSAREINLLRLFGVGRKLLDLHLRFGTGAFVALTFLFFVHSFLH